MEGSSWTHLRSLLPEQQRTAQLASEPLDHHSLLSRPQRSLAKAFVDHHERREALSFELLAETTIELSDLASRFKPVCKCSTESTCAKSQCDIVKRWTKERTFFGDEPAAFGETVLLLPSQADFGPLGERKPVDGEVYQYTSRPVSRRTHFSSRFS